MGTHAKQTARPEARSTSASPPDGFICSLLSLTSGRSSAMGQAMKTRARSWLLLCVALAACDAKPSSTEPAATSTASASATTATSATSVTPAASSSSSQRAQALAKRVIIVDGHVDLPYRLNNQTGAKDDPAGPCPDGNFDFPRAKQGGLDAPFMSIYIPAKHQTEGGAKALADSLIDMVEGIANKAPDKFAIAHSVAAVRDNFAAGKVSLPLGIENGAALEGKLDNLQHFYDRGVRYITLTHSEDNDICDSSYDDAHTSKGLTSFGKKVVAEMNRIGIMIDVSHISDDAFWQVMKLTETPVVATHSSLRHFTPGFERNMSDEMLEALGKNKGVLMINFGSSFIDDQSRQQRSKAWKARKAFMKKEGLERNDPKVKAFDEQYKKDHELPFATVEQVADHIVRAVEIAGIDHVGLGSDFDGVGDSLPTGLKDASQLPNLLRVLLDRGYSEQDIEKICSGNILRVWRAAELHAEAAKSK